MKKINLLAKLEKDIFYQILYDYLSPIDVENLSATSKEMRLLGHSNRYWKKKLLDHFPFTKSRSYQVSNESNDYWLTYTRVFFSELDAYSQRTNLISILTKDGDIQHLKKLKVKKNELKAIDSSRHTLTFYANKNRHQQVLDYFFNIILSKEKITNIVDWLQTNQSQTILTKLLGHAITCNQTLIVKPLLEAAAKTTHTIEKLSALGLAAKYNCPEINTLLLDHCPDAINKHEASGTSPLLIAVSCNHQAIARQLLAKGANIDLAASLPKDTGQGFRPINLAISLNHTDMALMLVKKGAKLGKKEQEYPLICLAAAKNNLIIIRALMCVDASLAKEKDYLGDTALHYAIASQKDDAALYLLEHTTIDLEASSNSSESEHHRYTALYLAVKLNRTALVAKLIAMNAKTDTIEGMPPLLHIALWNKNSEIIRHLVRKAPDCLYEGYQSNQNALCYLTQRQYQSLTDCLMTEAVTQLAQVSPTDDFKSDDEKNTHITSLIQLTTKMLSDNVATRSVGEENMSYIRGKVIEAYQKNSMSIAQRLRKLQMIHIKLENLLILKLKTDLLVSAYRENRTQSIRDSIQKTAKVINELATIYLKFNQINSGNVFQLNSNKLLQTVCPSLQNQEAWKDIKNQIKKMMSTCVHPPIKLTRNLSFFKNSEKKVKNSEQEINKNITY